ncbi:MAG: type II toxin-antitoxin system RelB/DinJ family antitoxin [Patescibacteria group bacterium]
MKTLISIKADPEVKTRAQRVAKEIGIPLSTIINAYLKQLGREKSINFAVPLRPNKKTARAIRQADKDYKKGVNISPVFETSEEMDAYLDA